MQQLWEQWTSDLERLEEGYADGHEGDADPIRLAQIDGMVVAYQQIISDTA